MTMTPLTCYNFADDLAACLEGDAAPSVRAAVDAHAASCAECAALRAELVAIQQAAAALPLLAPPRDLWAGIDERLENRGGERVDRVVPISSAAGRQGARRPATQRPSRRWWTHPALAAAALVAVTAGVTHHVTRGALVEQGHVRTGAGAPTVLATGTTIEAEPQQQVLSGSSPGAESLGEDVSSTQAGAPSGSRAPAANRGGSPGRRLASGTQSSPAPGRTTPVVAVSYREGDIAALDSLYYREIMRLRTVLGERRTELDSTTVAVIDRNMLVIDRAIQECRAALAADPASKFLNQQLNEALESKIELLRTAAMMPVGS